MGLLPEGKQCFNGFLGEMRVKPIRTRQTSWFLLGFFGLLGLFEHAAWAQGNSEAMPAPKFVVDPCKKDVLKFQEDLRALKTAMGDEAAKEFQNKFMPREAWDAILLNEGYCGLSKRLREKKLVR